MAPKRGGDKGARVPATAGRWSSRQRGQAPSTQSTDDPERLVRKSRIRQRRNQGGRQRAKTTWGGRASRNPSVPPQDKQAQEPGTAPATEQTPAGPETPNTSGTSTANRDGSQEQHSPTSRSRLSRQSEDPPPAGSQIDEASQQTGTGETSGEKERNELSGVPGKVGKHGLSDNEDDQGSPKKAKTYDAPSEKQQQQEQSGQSQQDPCGLLEELLGQHRAAATAAAMTGEEVGAGPRTASGEQAFPDQPTLSPNREQGAEYAGPGGLEEQQILEGILRQDCTTSETTETARRSAGISRQTETRQMQDHIRLNDTTAINSPSRLNNDMDPAAPDNQTIQGNEQRTKSSGHDSNQHGSLDFPPSTGIPGAGNDPSEFSNNSFSPSASSFADQGQRRMPRTTTFLIGAHASLFPGTPEYNASLAAHEVQRARFAQTALHPVPTTEAATNNQEAPQTQQASAQGPAVDGNESKTAAPEQEQPPVPDEGTNESSNSGAQAQEDANFHAMFGEDPDEAQGESASPALTHAPSEATSHSLSTGDGTR